MDWNEITTGLDPKIEKQLRAKTKQVLAKRYFEYLSPSGWKSIEPQVSRSIQSVFQGLTAVSPDGDWTNTLVNYLAGEGQAIMDPEKIQAGGWSPEALARIWAAAVHALGTADYDSLVGPAGFDLALKNRSDAMELWVFSGTLMGHIACDVADVVDYNVYRPLLGLYDAGLRPVFFDKFELMVPIEEGKRRWFEIYNYADGRLVEAGRRDNH